MNSNPADTWDARAAALRILREQRVAVVATTEGEQPWASTVYYAEEAFTLYVNTPNVTTMLRNMRQNPRVSYAIDERRPTFFLQASGRATVVDDAVEFARAKALLAKKVPEAHVGHPNFTMVKIESEVVYVSDFRGGYRPRAEIIVESSAQADTRMPMASNSDSQDEAIPVVFHVGDERYATEARPLQIVHEAFERALPPAIKMNHRLAFESLSGDELFADNFVGDLRRAYGQVEIVVKVTPVVRPPDGTTMPFTNFGFDHLAIAVADRAGARDFLRDGLGMQVVRDDPHQTVLTTGNTSLFLFDARPGIPLSEPDPSRWHHLGFVVDNLEAALWRLQAFGGAVSSDFTLLERDERWSLYLHYQNGPVRLMIQISEIKPEARGFADPHRFADHMFDYSKGPYGARTKTT